MSSRSQAAAWSTFACVLLASCGGSGGAGGNGGGAAYTTADLQGSWQLNAIASGPAAPWWERGQVTVAADGSFTGTLTEDSGSPDPQSSKLAITSAGVVTLAASSSSRGAMDAHKTVFALTSTWAYDGSTTDLGVAVKTAGAYALQDLEGTWESNGLATGPGAPWWERAEATVAADGSFTGTTTESTGGGGPKSGVFSLSADGVVTLVGSTTYRAVVDAGKTVMVSTDTWSTGSPGTAELKVAVKRAGTYGLSDLAGTWEINLLGSGPGEPYWMRLTLTIAPDGTATGNNTDSRGGSSTAAATYSISSDGVVTAVGSSTFRAVMDAGKSVMVSTETVSGMTVLAVATRMN